MLINGTQINTYDLSLRSRVGTVLLSFKSISPISENTCDLGAYYKHNPIDPPRKASAKKAALRAIVNPKPFNQKKIWLQVSH